MPPRPPVYRPGVPGKAGQPKPARPKRTPQAMGDQNRGTAHERGYDRVWQRLRLMHLRANPFCKFHWDRHGVTVIADMVDHIDPVQLAPERRLDPLNLQSLCNACHNGPKQREDRAKFRRAGIAPPSSRFGTRVVKVNPD